MFLRRHYRKKNGETNQYWTLVQSVRTSRGPPQCTVATLGKLPGLDDQARVGWEHIAGILDGKARQRDSFEPAQFDPPQWATVELGTIRVERLRRFGEVFGTTYDLLLYDVASKYFEGQGAGNPQAKRCYSRDHRPDCVQVCITLVLMP